MDDKTILNKLETIFKDLFADSDFNFSPELSMENFEAWDSVFAFQLISAVEDEFDITFNSAILMELNSVQAIADEIKKELE